MWRVGKKQKGVRRGEGLLPTGCLLPVSVFSTEALSGLRSSVTIVSPFPALRKAQFDLINIQLPSHAKKAHYAVKETDPWQVSGK